MLVLSRRERDAIMIGHDIVVTVLSIGRDHVRIGIAAPQAVEVHREEVYRAIQEANRAAASAAAEGTELLAGLVGADQSAGAGQSIGGEPVRGEPVKGDQPVGGEQGERRVGGVPPEPDPPPS